jgi:hypothetical protein
MATNGNDSTGDGSIKKPFKTLMKCQEKANAGDIVNIRGGTYKGFTIADTDATYNYIHKFTKSGITYQAYNQEKVVFDFEFKDSYKYYKGKPLRRVTAFLVWKNTQDITFKDFDCTRVPALTYKELVAMKSSKLTTQSECFASYGKNIHFNRMRAYNNRAIGFYFLGTNSNNIAYRCDAFNNIGSDQATLGNCDGFGAHGTGAKFLECRAWDNSDDNYDCINSEGRNIFDTCWSFRINLDKTNIQDGNGFKIGGFNKDPAAKNKKIPSHVVKNCIATMAVSNGFYSNHQPGKAATWFNNRSYNNGRANFDMTEGSEKWELDSSGKVKDICGTREVLFFNIAHKYRKNLQNNGNQYGSEGNLYSARIPDKNNRFNSWNFRDITLSDSDFLSLDVSELAKERGKDGALPKVNFMKLNPKGPNYKKLKTIEDELAKYTVTDDGAIVKKTSSYSIDLVNY